MTWALFKAFDYYLQVFVIVLERETERETETETETETERERVLERPIHKVVLIKEVEV